MCEFLNNFLSQKCDLLIDCPRWYHDNGRTNFHKIFFFMVKSVIIHPKYNLGMNNHNIPPVWSVAVKVSVMLVMLMVLKVLKVLMLIHVLHWDLDPVVLSDWLDVPVWEGDTLHQAGLEEGQDCQTVELSSGPALSLTSTTTCPRNSWHNTGQSSTRNLATFMAPTFMGSNSSLD